MDFVPQQTDLDDRMQHDIHLRTVETLRAMLPATLDGTPDSIARRDRVALATVAALVPANPAEARLAALHVAATEHAGDCLRQVQQYPHDPRLAAQIRAQAASMGREARGYLNLLLRLQRVRDKREANNATRDSAAMTEHCTLGLMTDALDSLPPAPAQTPAAAPAAATPAQPAEKVHYRDYEEWTDEEKQRDRLRARADRYAILHTVRVQGIRQRGGLPENCDFEPPDPELLHAIITGNSSNLRWADTYKPYVPAEPHVPA